MFSLRGLYVDSTVSGHPGTVYQVPLQVCAFQGRTIKGARVSIVPEMKTILVFKLVASLGKYALENEMRIYALI